MDIDAIKAPRTHATWKKAYDAQELAKLMVELSVQLEVELNVATVNEVFAENKAYMLEKELKQAQDRIKERDEQNEWRNERHVMFVKELTHSDRKYKNTLTDLVNAMDRIQQLEEAGDALCENSNPSRWDSPTDAARKLTDQSNWNKVKEAKP
jgi:hypothetical protein